MPKHLFIVSTDLLSLECLQGYFISPARPIINRRFVMKAEARALKFLMPVSFQ